MRASGMGTHSVICSAPALQDLTDAWKYFAGATSADFADAQLRAIDHLCAAVADWPEYGRARDDVRKGLRSVRCNQSVIFYRVTSAAIEIVRVLDERHDVDTIFSDDT